MSSNPTSHQDMTPQEKRELLEKLLRERAAQSSKPPAEERAPDQTSSQAQPAIQRLDRGQKYFPLSSAQQRLWLLDQFSPGNPSFNVAILFRMKGALNLPALEQALEEIQNRHEILRANFMTVDGKPAQFLSPSRPLALHIFDLQADPEDIRASRAEDLANEDAQRPFDLSKDVLARANLYRLAPDDHLFQVTIHHIVFDGLSFNIFIQELAALYPVYARGGTPALPALQAQYIDYAAWEAQQFQDESTREQLDYWKKELGGSIPALDMSLDYPRPEMQTFRAGKVMLEIPESLTGALNTLSRQEGVTLFVSMLSAFYVLLARYTAQEDIIVGTPIARRSRPELENLLGVFLNNLALRVDLSGDINFRELMKRVRHTVLGAFAHQEIPFERLLNELRIERDLSHTPVFQVFFNLLDFRKGMKLEIPGLAVEAPVLPEIGSNFDITLYAQNWGDTLKLKLVYNADLFRPERMEEFLSRYFSLLEQAAANPEQPIFSYALPGSARQRQAEIVEGFRLLENRYAAFQNEEIEQSLPERFERQAAKYPNHMAIKTARYEWTYEILNCMANRAAHAILEHCGHSEERVALLFDHDAPMVAGMLGALKAGKTYIPLDPNYPRQRLEYMLADSQARVVVTNGDQRKLAQALAGEGIPIIDLDGLSESGREGNPGLKISPDTLAYILYTSGSTGQPKGVMQNHRNVLHFMRAYTNNLHIGARDRLTLLSSYSFDAAVMDIFGALLNGAALYPIDLKRGELTSLARYLNENQITIYHSTPTVYRFFLNTLTIEDEFPNIRLVVLGGEAVIRRDVELFRKHFPRECKMINGLGPTESTVSLQYFIDHDTVLHGSAVPVGFPVMETEVVLLNEAGEETSLLGEIAIRSPHVALGYWQKPEKTRSAFLTDPAWGGKRMYRTGDMGCRLPDGTIEFRGRKDFQVKIRGHRVEVGEVETRLAEHPGIKECAVTAVEEESGGKRLVAYFLPAGNPPSGGELRQFLQSRLPDYMVPSVFVPLQSMPVTPTGKIDRRALPDPEIKNSDVGHTQVAARNETEEKLAKIWQDLLGVRSIGIQDNFFELGGHSLMAVHMFTRIQQEFGVNLPLATLFQNATVEHLADVIDRKTAPVVWSSLVEIEPRGSHLPFFCVHGITGDILWFRDLARDLAPNYPFYGLQARGLDSVQEPLARIDEMATAYIEEIRRLQPKGPYYLGGASLGGTIALEIAQQLRDQGEEVALLAIFDHAPANIQMETQQGKLAKRLTILLKVLKNFPHWLSEFIKMGPDRMLMRLKRWLRVARKVKGRREVKNLDQLDAVDLIDFAGELPAHRRQLIVSHFQAMRIYQPKPYPGRVTLFRAMSRPLLNTSDPAQGWQRLSPGRVKVIDVPSSHEGMFKEPHVHVLAEKLRVCIDEVSSRN